MKISNFKFQISKWIACCLLPVGCCLFLTSCAPSKTVKPVEPGYQAVLEKWTRAGKVYEDFETRFLVNATYKSEDFRASYVKEYSRDYLLDPEKADNLMRAEMEASKKYHEFLLSIHTPVIEWSDLEKKNQIWAIYLVNDAGEKVSPVEIKKVKEKGPPVMRFYPYVDYWSAAYTVKFPLTLPDGKQFVTPETKYIKFIMTGTVAKGELVWKLGS